jgi:hypothetical protein
VAECGLMGRLMKVRRFISLCRKLNDRGSR